LTIIGVYEIAKTIKIVAALNKKEIRVGKTLGY